MSRNRSLLVPVLAVALSLTAACATGETDRRATSATTTTASTNEGAAAQADREPLRQVRQRARLSMHPQIADSGAKPRNARRADSAMTAQFSPRKKGRPVVLQRKVGKRWDTVAKSREDGRGRAEFTAPYKRKGKIQTYRAMAPRFKGLGKVRSKGVRTDVFDVDFNDQFSGDTLSASWQHQAQGYQPDSARTCSRVDPAAVQVRGGTARIRVIDDPARGAVPGADMCSIDGGSYHYRLNGHINTSGTEEFTRGFAAARVKFQKPRGQHASFWFYNVPTGHEVDVIEWFGKDHPQGGLTSFVYSKGVKIAPGCTGSTTQGCGFIQNTGQYGAKWWARYHVFSVEQTKKAFVFRIDGKQTFRTTKGVSDDPSYFNLSVLASDYELKYLDGDDAQDNEGQDALDRLKRVTMSVDWVRSWTR